MNSIKAIIVPLLPVIAAICLWGALQPAFARESDTWRAMVDGMRHDIITLDKELSRLEKGLAAKAEDMDAAMAKADDRLNQLLLLRGMAGSNPWAYRTILFQMHDLAAYIGYKKRPLLEDKALVGKGKLDYAAMRSVRRKGTNVEPVSPMNKQFLQGPDSDYARLKDKTKSVKERIDAILAEADNELEAVAAATNQTREVYIQRLGDFYFAEGPNMFSGRGLMEFSVDFRQWTNNLPRYWYPVVVWVHWGEFLLYSAVLCLALYFLGGRLWNKAARRFAFADRLRLHPRSRLWLSMGLAVAGAQYLTFFTTNQITYMFAFCMTALGGMQGAANFTAKRLPRDKSPGERDPLFAMWIAFVAGCVLMVLNVPDDCLPPFWFAVSLAGAMAMRRYRTLDITAREGMAASASFWVFALSAAASPFYFAAQAMALVQLWFILLLIARVVQALRLACMPPPEQPETPSRDAPPAEESEAGPEPEPARADEKPESTPATVPDAAAGEATPSLAYPLLAVVVAVAALGSFFRLLGGSGFSRYIFKMELTLGKVVITPEGVASVIAFFFLIKILLFWMTATMERLAAWGKIAPPLAHSLRVLASYALWIGWVVGSLAMINAPLSALTWIASGLSVGIGFGLKDIVNNFVSGLIIMFGGTIKRGDVILHKKQYGKVTDVSVRNTTILTRENSVVVIPNSSILKGDVVNMSGRDKRLRLSIPVIIAPGTKLKKVKKIMLKAASKHKHVMENPEPEVFFDAFGRFGMNATLYFWVDDFEKKFDTESALVFDLDQRFRDGRVMVAFRSAKIKYKIKKSPEEILLDHQEKRNAHYRLLRDRQRKVARAKPLGTKPRKA